jgi:hypothetical protein
MSSNQVLQKHLVDISRRNVVTDVFHFVQKAAGTVEVAVQKEHLRAKRNRNPLVSILKAMKFAGTEKQVGQLFLKGRVVVIVLDMRQNTFQGSQFEMPECAPTTDLNRLAVYFDGLLQR